MENKTYQFKKLTKEVLESLEPKGRYTILFCNGDVKQMVLELNTDGSGVFLDGFARFPISQYEDISVLLPISKVGEVTDKTIADLLFDFAGDLAIIDSLKYEERAISYAHKLRSLLQPQPVNSEGKEEEFSKDEQISILKHKVKLLKKEIRSVSSEGKKEQYRDGAPEHNPQNPHLGYKTAIFEPTIEQGEAKEPTK